MFVMTTDKVNLQRKRESQVFVLIFFIFKYLQTLFNFKTLNIW